MSDYTNINSHDHLADEEISAFVDGALDADESDRVVERRAGEHMAGCPQCSARRVELARAAGMVRAASIPPVDELTRQRMIDQALRSFGTAGVERRSGRWFAHPATAAVAAAAAAVFIAVGVISFDRPENRDSVAKSGSANEALATEAPMGQFLGDIGEVGEPDQLRAAIAGVATGAEGLSATVASPTSTITEFKGTSPTDKDGVQPLGAPSSYSEAEAGKRLKEPSADADAAAKTDADRDAARHCAQVTQLSIDTAGDLIGDGSNAQFSSELTFSAVGTSKGAAVVILVYTTKEGGQQIFVVARGDCTILSFLGTPGSP